MKELDEAFELLHREAREAPGDLTGARAKLMAELHGVTPLPRRRRWQVPAAAAAVVLVTASVIGIKVYNARTPELELASEVLHKAADSLGIHAVDPSLADGQYRLVSEHVWSARSTVQYPDSNTGYTYRLEQRIDRWIPKNDRDLWQETRTVVGTPQPIGSNVPVGPPSLSDNDTGTRTGACGNFFPKSKPPKVCGDQEDWDSPEFYAKLSRDPEVLYGQIVKQNAHRSTEPAPVFHYAVQVLAAGMMPADLRAQWYRAMAKIPGIQVFDQATTLDGRRGVSIGLTTENEQRELVIDPATGEFIGERTLAGAKPYDAWIPPGTETYARTITTKVVNGLGVPE
ncbi:CU044_5270 family protein [Lentzea sp. CA-135723]|uniref:CU044_5270 family protein n=1 Tax=Lentzea sp. CA-135723 TaxID=3239950 RepID=UPI003D8E8AC1